MYDYVIVGAGPAGLALAQRLARHARILIIDKEHSIGGCHRVRRVLYNKEFLFTEHGPRIYSSAYVNVRRMLSDMGSSFETFFTPYHYGVFQQIIERTKNIGSRDMMYLFWEFTKLMAKPSYGLNISVKEVADAARFSPATRDVLDRLCRLTDGASIENYSINKFLHIANQHFFYQIYQPKQPNDVGLFAMWEKYLRHHAVDIATDTELETIVERKGKVVGVRLNAQGRQVQVRCGKLILAVPPVPMVHIFEKSGFANLVEHFGAWAEDTRYLDYISLTLHWSKDVPIPSLQGFLKSDWALAFIVLTDYMAFDEVQSKTVMSVAITDISKRSARIGKQAKRCTKEEIFAETMYQLRETLPDLPTPTAIVMNPGNRWVAGEWMSMDTAYIRTPKAGPIPFQAPFFENLFLLGNHNSHSTYEYSSMETAVTNAIALANRLNPTETIPLLRPWYLRDAITTILFILVVWVMGHYVRF